MIGFAADNATDGNQCVKALRAGHRLQHQRYFQCAGYGGYGDVVVLHAQFVQFFYGGFEHGRAYFVGKARLDDADT